MSAGDRRWQPDDGPEVQISRDDHAQYLAGYARLKRHYDALGLARLTGTPEQVAEIEADIELERMDIEDLLDRALVVVDDAPIVCPDPWWRRAWRKVTGQ